MKKQCIDTSIVSDFGVVRATVITNVIGKYGSPLKGIDRFQI